MSGATRAEHCTHPNNMVTCVRMSIDVFAKLSSAVPAIGLADAHGLLQPSVLLGTLLDGLLHGCTRRHHTDML
eukprot:5846404-Pleurochrysis_carterae.AAC.1